MKLSLAEQETIITYDNEGDTAQVFTYHRPLINKLTKRGVKPERVTPEGGHAFTVSKTWVSVRPKARRKGQPGAGERLQRARLAQKHPLPEANGTRSPLARALPLCKVVDS